MTKVASRIKTMLEIQSELNKKVHPEWEKQNYPYPDAIFTEATEAFNHLNWEWWKQLKRVINWDQVKMEVVDIGHFLFSEVVCNQLEDKFIHIAGEVEKENWKRTEPDVKVVRETLKAFIASVIMYDNGEDEAYSSFYLFFYLIEFLNMNLDDFYKLYVGKVCLNEVRWANGYKKGIYYGNGVYEKDHYVKVWDGKEDNEWLSEKIEQLDIDSPTFKQDLSSALNEKYKQVRDQILNNQYCHGVS